MSGCAQLFEGPAQYVSLPKNEVPDSGLSIAQVSQSAELSRSSQQDDNVNPDAVLEKSIRKRENWTRLDPTDLTGSAGSLVGRHRATKAAEKREPKITNSLRSEKGISDRAEMKPGDYNRHAAMDLLVKGGHNAVKGVCTGC